VPLQLLKCERLRWRRRQVWSECTYFLFNFPKLLLQFWHSYFPLELYLIYLSAASSLLRFPHLLISVLHLSSVQDMQTSPVQFVVVAFDRRVVLPTTSLTLESRTTGPRDWHDHSVGNPLCSFLGVDDFLENQSWIPQLDIWGRGWRAWRYCVWSKTAEFDLLGVVAIVIVGRKIGSASGPDLVHM